jgi:ABC-type multidrug transport system fused ATPase/permease subunit
MIQTPGIDRLTIVPLLFSLLAFNSFHCVVSGQIYHTGRKVGNRSRIVLVDELYKKSLHRVQSSSVDDEQASLGKIVTLMSVDTEQIRIMISYCQDVLVSLPFSFVIALSSLCLILGLSALAGVAVMLLIGPLTTYIGSFVVDYEENVLEQTDARVSLINEVLQGIRIIKYFAWEKQFSKKIEIAREKEIQAMIQLFKANVGFWVIGGSFNVDYFGYFFFLHLDRR